MITYGTKPTGYHTIYSKDKASKIDVKKGDIYGAKFQMDVTIGEFQDISKIEQSILEETVDKIRKRGDQPIYVEVSSEFQYSIPGKVFGHDVYTVYVTFFAKKVNSGTPLFVLVALAVSAILSAIALLVHELKNYKYQEWYIKYYEEHGKPPKPPSPGDNKTGWLAGLEGLLLLILIIYIIKEFGKR